EYENMENLFIVTDNLTVDGQIYIADPWPQANDTFSTITGVLHLSWERNKLSPRGPADYAFSGDSTISMNITDGVFLYEGATDAATTPDLKVQLVPAPSEDTFIAVTSGDTGVVTVKDGGVTIAAFSTEASVILTGVAAGGPVTLTATYVTTEYTTTVTAPVTVLATDAVALPVSLAPTPTDIIAGASQIFTLTMSAPAPASGQVVALTSTGVALTHDATVTVPAMAISTTFTVDAGSVEGVATLTATVGTTAVDATINIHEISATPTGLLLVEVLYDADGVDDGLEWVKLYNGTGAELNLSGYSLGWGGTDYTYGTMQLTGTVGAGSCFIVGGTTSNEVNFNPVFDQPEDFNPDIQNGGTKADGIALFNSPAGEITANSIPIDAVIYGSFTTNGLIGPDGEESPAHVAKATGDMSIYRTSMTTWVDSTMATTNQGCIVIQPVVE
ncbi:lamin tail domain-containing protein, partial [Myxococcota bacterium]|nr:lamin tail domain-containing protein [Myxococcota bacterium]